MTEFPENNYVQFYGFYFNQVKEPFVIEALNSGKSYGKKDDKETEEKTTTDTAAKKSETK